MKRCASIIAAMLLAAVAAHAQGLTVTTQPATVQYKTFDPRNPPKDMPKTSGGESAVTHYEFGISLRLSYEPIDAGIRIQSITVQTTMSVVVWLPRDCPPALRAHEEAHRQLAEMFYKDAGTIARKAARPYIGQTITGQGKDDAAARKDAISNVNNAVIRSYISQTKEPAARVNGYFDEITSHGANRKIDADQGKQRALDRLRNEDIRGRTAR